MASSSPQSMTPKKLIDKVHRFIALRVPYKQEARQLAEIESYNLTLSFIWQDLDNVIFEKEGLDLTAIRNSGPDDIIFTISSARDQLLTDVVLNKPEKRIYKNTGDIILQPKHEQELLHHMVNSEHITRTFNKDASGYFIHGCMRDDLADHYFPRVYDETKNEKTFHRIYGIIPVPSVAVYMQDNFILNQQYLHDLGSLIPLARAHKDTIHSMALADYYKMQNYEQVKKAEEITIAKIHEVENGSIKETQKPPENPEFPGLNPN